MDYVQKTMINMIRAQLNPQYFDDLVINCDWTALDDLIKKQSMRGALYPIINKLAQEGRLENHRYIPWRDLAINAGLSQLGRVEQIIRVIAMFNTQGIPIIVLKGPSIARFYEYPELRISGDIDLLIQQRDLPQVRHLMNANGYRILKDVEKHPFELEYQKDGDIGIDVHFALFNPAVLRTDKGAKWYEHIWNNYKMVEFEATNIAVMADEDELINQIIHFGRHLIGTGARMSHLFDMALVIKQRGSNIDWNYIGNYLEDFGLLKLASVLFQIYSEFFEIDLPKSVIKEKSISISPDDVLYYLLTDLFQGNNRVANQFSRGRYRYLFKTSLTLPIAYSLELLEQLAIEKNSLAYSVTETRYKLNRFLKKRRLINVLGLADWERT